MFLRVSICSALIFPGLCGSGQERQPDNVVFAGAQGWAGKYLGLLMAEHRFSGPGTLFLSLASGIANHQEEQDMSKIVMAGNGYLINGGAPFGASCTSGYIVSEAKARYQVVIPKLGYRYYFWGRKFPGVFWGLNAGLLSGNERVELTCTDIWNGNSGQKDKKYYEVLFSFIGLEAGITRKIWRELVFNFTFGLPYYYHVPAQTEHGGPFHGTKPEIYAGLGWSLKKKRKQ